MYLLPASNETVQWGWFDNAEAAAGARIRSGDTLVMETMMASLNQVLPGVPVDEITRLRVAHPGRGPHTITGPVFVEGAMPGDVLKIRLNRIVPRTYGANWNLPGHLKLGQFPDTFSEPQVKYFYLRHEARRSPSSCPASSCRCGPFPGSSASRAPRAASSARFRPGPSAATWMSAS